MGKGASIENFGPSDLLTSPRFGSRRLQVDQGSTGFFENREFRFFREVTIPAAESRWTRVIVEPGDFGIIIKLQRLAVDAGAIRFRAWRDTSPVGLTFSAPASPLSGLFANNNLPSAPAWEPKTIIENAPEDAAPVGGEVAEIVRVRSAGATAQKSTVGQAVIGERGIGPGVYHLQFENITNDPATAVYELIYEERTGRV